MGGAGCDVPLINLESFLGAICTGLGSLLCHLKFSEVCHMIKNFHTFYIYILS